MNSLKQLDLIGELRDLAAAAGADAGVLGVLTLYVFGVVWLIYRWRTRNQRGRREQLSCGMAFMDAFARFFAVVVMLLVGIIAAAFRASTPTAAGRRNLARIG